MLEFFIRLKTIIISAWGILIKIMELKDCFKEDFKQCLYQSNNQP